MCKNVISTIYVLFASIFILNAQNLDIGFFVGTTGYMGDLQTSHFEKDEISLAGGIIGKYRVNEFLDARLGFTKGTISGSDKGTRNESRNLSFKSQIKEVNAMAEFHFLSFINGDRPLFSPYVFGGLAVFHHNPKAIYENQWYDLQPLKTEGQNSVYGLYQLSIPMGVGAQLYVSDAISLGFEGGLRKTFTDYLDDVSGTYGDLDSETNSIAAGLSYRTPEYLDDELPNPLGNQRGNPNRKDVYWYTGVTFMVNISGLMEMAGGPGTYNPF